MLEKNREIKQSCTRLEKTDICIYLIFDHWCKKLILGEEKGHYGVCIPNFKAFLILNNMLRSCFKSFGSSGGALCIGFMVCGWVQILWWG